MPNRVTHLLKVIAHTVIGAVGVPIITAIVTFATVGITRPFAPQTSPKLPNVLLTEIPGFPLQVVIGLVIGYLMWKLTKQHIAYWAWVLPSVILLVMILRSAWSYAGGGGIYNLVALPLEHFLGAECNLKQHCFDQVIYTLPTIAATSYSMGVFIASRGLRRWDDPKHRKIEAV